MAVRRLEVKLIFNESEVAAVRMKFEHYDAVVFASTQADAL